MAVGKEEKQFIKKSNKTYYWNSKILPKKYRADMLALYNFVRASYNLATEEPKKLHKLASGFSKAMDDPAFDQIALGWDGSEERALKHIVRLTHKYKFEQAEVEAFFASMKQDADHTGYANYEELLKYMRGTAEAVGYMIAKILHLPEDVQPVVMSQAQAIQWAKFICNIHEDFKQERTYFPRNELRAYHLKDVSLETAQKQSYDMKRFINFELKRYDRWQAEANKGLETLPTNLQEAFKAAAWIYKKTTDRIRKNPMIVYDKTVRPHKAHLVWEKAKRVTHKTAKLLAAQEKTATKK